MDKLSTLRAKNDKPVEQAGPQKSLSDPQVAVCTLTAPGLVHERPEGRSDTRPASATSVSENKSPPRDDADDQSDDSWHSKWPENRDSVVLQFVDAFAELIFDFGASIEVQQSFRGGATEFLLTDDEITYWNRAKNLCCFFKAKYLQNALPDVSGYRFNGSWKKWAMSRMKSSRKNTSLWSSTFKLKNAACRLSEEAAVVTMHKHRASVSKTMLADEKVIVETVDTIAPLLERAALHLRNRFNSGAWKSPGAASNSACYENSRSELGQVAYLMKMVFGENSPMVAPGIGFCGFGPQILTGCIPSYIPRGEKEEWNIFARHSYDPETYEARLRYAELEETPVVKKTVFYEAVVVDGIQYENSWFETFYFPDSESFWMNEIWIDALRQCDRDVALAKVACVLEPFKVRIITKGPAALQQISTFFQESMFEFNRTVPCFKLVGKAPFAADLQDIRANSGQGDRKSAWGPMSMPVWASSDFSGASDGTCGFYRDEIMRRLVKYLPQDWQSLIEFCNGDHEVKYPSEILFPSMAHYGQPAPVEQTLGTLMGEKTSFIILCYEVLAAHVSNLRRCGDVRDLTQVLRGVLINGDDRLCVSTRALEEEFWAFCEKYLGFKESKGKSYTHVQYANINSQSYLCDLLVANSTPWKVPVRASGLEHGQKKLDEPFDPTAVITQILDGCINPKMEWTVLQRYMKRFAADLERIAAGRNLFVHPSLGGLGNRLPNLHPRGKCIRSDGTPCNHGHVDFCKWKARPSNLGRFYPGQTWRDWRVIVTDEQRFVAGAILAEDANFMAVPFGPTMRQEEPLPQLLEVPWDVYGKPTYWNQEEFELKEMGHKYRHLLRSYQPGTQIPDPLTVLFSKKKKMAGGGTGYSTIFEGNQSIWHCRHCSGRNVDGEHCPCGFDQGSWRCEICEEWNSPGKTACGTCLIEGEPLELIRVYSVPVYSSRVAPLRNVSLSRPRLGRMGYAPYPLDEFDLSLRAFAIDCARFELPKFPTVRTNGRAIDLFGDHPEWAPLRPATLVWD